LTPKESILEVEKDKSNKLLVKDCLDPRLMRMGGTAFHQPNTKAFLQFHPAAHLLRRPALYIMHVTKNINMPETVFMD
jgi:hypothetical protein